MHGGLLTETDSKGRRAHKKLAKILKKTGNKDKEEQPRTAVLLINIINTSSMVFKNQNTS